MTALGVNLPAQPARHPEVPQAPSRGLPAELSALFEASEEVGREEAWGRFVERYSLLLLHAAGSARPGYDSRMNRYGYMLDQLRRDHYRRLRKFEPDGRSSFSTWLVVVARRLCIDFHRQRYGRAEGVQDGSPRDADRAGRRHLADLVGDTEEITEVPDSRATITREYTARERDGALERVLHTLDAGDSLLIKLRYQDDLTAKEIARVLGLASQAQVYRRLEVVLGRLRGKLELAGIRSLKDG
jgi:RNA polymerase sigma factor (sigma-70 family)